MKHTKKLYTGKVGTIAYIQGFPVIGGKQYRIAPEDNSEIRTKVERGTISELEGFVFPMEANQVDFNRYLRLEGGNVKAAAEHYLKDIGEKKSLNPADVAAEVVEEVKPTKEKVVETKTEETEAEETKAEETKAPVKRATKAATEPTEK